MARQRATFGIFFFSSKSSTVNNSFSSTPNFFSWSIRMLTLSFNQNKILNISLSLSLLPSVSTWSHRWSLRPTLSGQNWSRDWSSFFRLESWMKIIDILYSFVYPDSTEPSSSQPPKSPGEEEEEEDGLATPPPRLMIHLEILCSNIRSLLGGPVVLPRRDLNKQTI